MVVVYGAVKLNNNIIIMLSLHIYILPKTEYLLHTVMEYNIYIYNLHTIQIQTEIHKYNYTHYIIHKYWCWIVEQETYLLHLYRIFSILYSLRSIWPQRGTLLPDGILKLIEVHTHIYILYIAVHSWCSWYLLQNVHIILYRI